MDENPYAAPQKNGENLSGGTISSRPRMPGVLAAFVVGLFAGFFALASGRHGGTPWPTILLSAPAYFVADALLDIVGDRGYRYGMVCGTGLQYALYSYLLMRPTRWRVLFVVAVHFACAIIIMVLVFLN